MVNFTDLVAYIALIRISSYCFISKPLQMIELMRDQCNIGSTSIESFRQQAWLAYEHFFFENYSEKLLKLYQVS